MSCCRSGPVEQMFRPETARQSLDSYRKKGLGVLSRRMVAAAVGGGLEGARVLDVGGGIGAIQAELLESGAERGEIVELVASYEEPALELAREKGLEGRVSYRVADILESPEAVDPADVVILNRVVCCSPDGVDLAEAAARLTRRTLVLSFPRDVFWARAGVRLLNAGLWLMRRSFRVFVHPTRSLIAATEGEGLRVVERGRDTFWEFVALGRP
jgi:2-polyprenyl-3-methyl-5-hydroxy-6-metoxy-1,4-benzoquinol methylase